MHGSGFFNSSCMPASPYKVVRYKYEYKPPLDQLFQILLAFGINAFSSDHISEDNYGYASVS